MRTIRAALFLGLAVTAFQNVQAVEINVSRTYAVSAEKVWNTIKGFCSIKDWHPAIAECTENMAGDFPQRTLETGDGAKILEVGLYVSDKTKTFNYKIIESPLPVIDYWSVMAVEAVGENAAQLTWSARFDAPAGKEQAASDLIATIYTAGLDSLSKMLVPQ